MCYDSLIEARARGKKSRKKQSDAHTDVNYVFPAFMRKFHRIFFGGHRGRCVNCCRWPCEKQYKSWLATERMKWMASNKNINRCGSLTD